MATQISGSFFDEVKSFVSNHRILCALTLGFAIAGYALGNLGGRVVSWICASIGITKKTDTVARDILSPIQQGERRLTSLRQEDVTLNPVLSDADLIDKGLNIIKKKFNTSVPNLPPNSKSTLFTRECDRLLNFLDKGPSTAANSSNDDLTYVCLGAGNVKDQIWPGFVLEHLQNGKRVHSLILEYEMYGVGPKAANDLRNEYSHFDANNSQLYRNLDGFSVDQFLCGMPADNEESYEEQTSEVQRLCSAGVFANRFWRTKSQIETVQKKFESYVETLLIQGKQVVLGDHRGGLDDLNDPLVKVYNKFIQKYPKQLHFVWGWEERNRVTNKPITSDDVDPVTKAAIWTEYPADAGGLNRCTFT